MKSFGQSLQDLMNTRRESAKDLSKVIGVSAKTIQEWIGKGGRMPRKQEHIKALAEHFNVTVHVLLFGEEDPQSLVGELLRKAEVHTGLYEISIRKVEGR